jgi:PPM family protein phosphatase
VGSKAGSVGAFWRDRHQGMIDSGWASARARRPDNQDRCACSTRWAVLSDGIGGYAGGAVAADLAVAAAVAVLERAQTIRARNIRARNIRAQDNRAQDKTASAVHNALDRANAEVRAARQRHPKLAHTGATLTLALANAGGTGPWTVANVGDSPGWLVRQDGTQRVTEEHNLAAELLRRRVISADEAARHPGRHVLSRAIGIEEMLVPSVTTVEFARGDRLVLASDGLGAAVDTSMLHQLLRPVTELPATEQARRLVDLALAGGATDNVTVVVLCLVTSSAVASGTRVNRRAAMRPLVWR